MAQNGIASHNRDPDIFKHQSECETEFPNQDVLVKAIKKMINANAKLKHVENKMNSVINSNSQRSVPNSATGRVTRQSNLSVKWPLNDINAHQSTKHESVQNNNRSIEIDPIKQTSRRPKRVVKKAKVSKITGGQGHLQKNSSDDDGKSRAPKDEDSSSSFSSSESSSDSQSSWSGGDNNGRSPGGNGEDGDDGSDDDDDGDGQNDPYDQMPNGNDGDDGDDGEDGSGDDDDDDNGDGDDNDNNNENDENEEEEEEAEEEDGNFLGDGENGTDYTDSEDENPMAVVLPPVNARPSNAFPPETVNEHLSGMKGLMRKIIDFHQDDYKVEERFSSVLEDEAGLLTHHAAFWPTLLGTAATNIKSNVCTRFCWLHYSADLLRSQQAGVAMPPAKATAEVLQQLLCHQTTLNFTRMDIPHRFQTAPFRRPFAYGRSQFIYTFNSRSLIASLNLSVRYQASQSEIELTEDPDYPKWAIFSEETGDEDFLYISDRHSDRIRTLPIAKLKKDREHRYNRNICYLVAMLVMLYDDDDDDDEEEEGNANADGGGRGSDGGEGAVQPPPPPANRARNQQLELKRLLKYANRPFARSQKNNPPFYYDPSELDQNGHLPLQPPDTTPVPTTTLRRFLHSAVAHATVVKADSTLDSIRFDTPPEVEQNGAVLLHLSLRGDTAAMTDVGVAIQQTGIAGCIALLAIAKALPDEPASEEGRRKYLPAGGELEGCLEALANQPAAWGIFPVNTWLATFTRAQLEYIQLCVLSQALRAEMEAVAEYEEEDVEEEDEAAALEGGEGEGPEAAETDDDHANSPVWAIYPPPPTTRNLSYGYSVLGGHDVDLHPYQLLNVVWPPPPLPLPDDHQAAAPSTSSISSAGRFQAGSSRGAKRSSSSFSVRSGKSSRSSELLHYSYVEVLVLTPGPMSVGYAQLMSAEKPEWVSWSRGAVLLNVNTGVLTVDGRISEKEIKIAYNDNQAMVVSIARCTTAPYEVVFFVNGRFIAREEPRIDPNFDPAVQSEAVEVKQEEEEEDARGRRVGTSSSSQLSGEEEQEGKEPQTPSLPVPELLLTVAPGCYQQALLLRHPSQWQWAGECAVALNRRTRHRTVRFRELVVSERLQAIEARMMARVNGETEAVAEGEGRLRRRRRRRRRKVNMLANRGSSSRVRRRRSPPVRAAVPYANYVRPPLRPLPNSNQPPLENGNDDDLEAAEAAAYAAGPSTSYDWASAERRRPSSSADQLPNKRIKVEVKSEDEEKPIILSGSSSNQGGGTALKTDFVKKEEDSSVTIALENAPSTSTFATASSSSAPTADDAGSAETAVATLSSYESGANGLEARSESNSLIVVANNSTIYAEDCLPITGMFVCLQCNFFV